MQNCSYPFLQGNIITLLCSGLQEKNLWRWSTLKWHAWQGEVETQCYPDYEPKCKTDYKTGYKQFCSTIEDTECYFVSKSFYKTIYSKKCSTSYKKSCHDVGYGYHKEKKCTSHPVHKVSINVNCTYNFNSLIFLVSWCAKENSFLKTSQKVQQKAKGKMSFCPKNCTHKEMLSCTKTTLWKCSCQEPCYYSKKTVLGCQS